jgi:hypothetical protein
VYLVKFSAFPAFHCAEEEKLSSIISALLSPLFHDLGDVHSGSMGARWPGTPIRLRQRACTCFHVLLLFPHRTEARIEKVTLVEKAHHTNSNGKQ